MAEHRAFRGHSVEQISVELEELQTQLTRLRNLIELSKKQEVELTCAIREAQTALKLATLKDHYRTPKLQVRIGSGKELLSRADLMRELGVCSTTLKAMCDDGRLPAPVRISRRSTGFRRSDIRRWISDEATTMQTVHCCLEGSTLAATPDSSLQVSAAASHRESSYI